MGSLQLGGKTLKEMLERTVRSAGYNRLPTLDDGLDPTGRISVLNNIIHQYEAHAHLQMKREFPEVAKALLDQRTKAMQGQMTQYRAFSGASPRLAS